MKVRDHRPSDSESDVGIIKKNLELRATHKEAILEPLLTIPQVAELLNVKPKTIRRWVYREEIPYEHVGRLIRFVPSKIKAWLDARSVEPRQ